jgi:hypothetical protein
MTVSSDRTALFIDGANLYSTAKALGFDIDYKRLLKEFQSQGTLVRAFYYTAVTEDQEFSSVRPLLNWLDYNGFTVVTKPTKEFIDANGHRKVKGNTDIELNPSAAQWRATMPRMDVREAGRRGPLATNKKLSKTKRSANARKPANARWSAVDRS